MHGITLATIYDPDDWTVEEIEKHVRHMVEVQAKSSNVILISEVSLTSAPWEGNFRAMYGYADVAPIGVND